ncbi:Linoleate 9/13-lipoxygenase [Diplonema papillatum]|nr:Linoleate 9/13-lipoxygenase [Diplonema papillatum]
MIPADAAQNKREGLQVLCVQVRKGEPSSIAAPSDNKWAWTYAKVFFNHVESNLQESVHHLGETHLLVQSIGLSVKRSLPLDHPLHVLVDNHLHGTLTINWMANQTLLQPDGPVDTVLSTERVAFCEAAVQGVAAIAKADFTFPALMRARGLDEAAFPTKYYPYREFAGKLWNAIERFVGEYVAAYYPSDRAVNADGSLSHLRSELEQNGVAWVKSAWKRGRGSVKFLSKLLSAFVFTASVQHAAVGAPQLSHLSVINVFPLGWYSDPPADIADIDTEEELLAAFPELPTAYHQRDVLAGAAFAYRTFAVFDPSTYPEGAVRSAAEEFQRDLRQAEADMAARNEHWLSLWAHQTNVPQSQHANWQYKALYPSSVSMSVNV